MRGNRLIVLSCNEKSIKDNRRVFGWTDEGRIMPCGRRRTRRRKQRGGILPLLIPAAIALGKAAALGAASGAAGYGAKKAIQAATRKKKVGKISAKQMAANQRRVQRMLGRTGWGGFKTLRKL